MTQQKVPLLDLDYQHNPIKEELTKAFLDVLDTGRFIMGPKVEELEAKIADYCGAKFAIGVSSGTDALLIALMGLDITQGDIVLTTPYSFFATAGVIARLGAEPRFVDIDPKTLNMSPNKLADWFEENPTEVKKVKAIMPVHLYGQSADMDPIMDLANKFDIPVIEDAAQAIGALYPSRNGIRGVGTIGKIGCLSFFPSKNLGAFGDGGMVLTNDEALAERISLLRLHGAKPKYYHSIIGGNFRIDALQAAILLVKLPYLDSWASERRQNAAWYDENLADSSVAPLLKAYPTDCHAYNQYVIRAHGHRDALKAFLNERGIGTEVYYPVPFHLQDCFKYLGYIEGSFPESESAARESLAIPVCPGLSQEQLEYVVSSIGEFYAQENMRSRGRALG